MVFNIFERLRESLLDGGVLVHICLLLISLKLVEARVVQSQELVVLQWTIHWLSVGRVFQGNVVDTLDCLRLPSQCLPPLLEVVELLVGTRLVSLPASTAVGHYACVAVVNDVVTFAGLLIVLLLKGVNGCGTGVLLRFKMQSFNGTFSNYDGGD